MARPPVRTPARRRQRSVRVSVAVTLMALGTLLVLAALPLRSTLVTGIAAVVALGFAWAALRMMWTEVLQSRRENAADRAAAASAYKSLFSTRAAEHAEFTTAMTERLAQSQLTMRELEATLDSEQKRAAVAEVGLADSSRSLEETRAELDALAADHRRLEQDHAEALVALEEAAAGRGQDLIGVELADFEAQVQHSVDQGKHSRSA